MLVMHSINVVRRNRRLQTCGDFHHYYSLEEPNLMLITNPKFVLRNHLGEQAIRAAKLGDFGELQTLQRLLERPFDEHPGHDAYAAFPPDWASSIEISCSS